MKCVIYSIKPHWVELICSGKKTIEVRKTIPKSDLPLKCFIYATKEEELWKVIGRDILVVPTCDNRSYIAENEYYSVEPAEGKIIGEFTCKEIDHYECTYFEDEPDIPTYLIPDDDGKRTCLSYQDCVTYGNGKDLHFIHIDDLIIYDHPKSITDFFSSCKAPEGTDCSVCVESNKNTCKPITRPPQSWCYTEV